jgi:hypothetical protein
MDGLGMTLVPRRPAVWDVEVSHIDYVAIIGHVSVDLGHVRIRNIGVICPMVRRVAGEHEEAKEQE